MAWMVLAAQVPAEDPGVRPNVGGLPGLSELLGAMLVAGIVSCVAGLAVSAVVWGVAARSGNARVAGRGRTAMVVFAVAALVMLGLQ